MCSVHAGMTGCLAARRSLITALLAAASYAQNITERPSEIVWSEERLGEFARGNRFGGRRHETVGSLAADRGARAYLGLRPQARCKAFVRLGTTSDGGRQACVRGVDQAAADALQCAWRFDSRWCKGFLAVARVEPNAYSNVLLNVSIATVADLDVLCCYESAIVATRPPRGASCR